ncbi:hypothetical protein D3C84_1224790 [compost metagenome]
MSILVFASALSEGVLEQHQGHPQHPAQQGGQDKDQRTFWLVSRQWLARGIQIRKWTKGQGINADAF